jgi:hypothetical protein
LDFWFENKPSGNPDERGLKNMEKTKLRYRHASKDISERFILVFHFKNNNNLCQEALDHCYVMLFFVDFSPTFWAKWRFEKIHT